MSKYRRCYTIQTIDVIAELYNYQTYKPKWEHSEFIRYDECISEGYIWLVDEYNKRMNNEYLGPLVWWYTDYKEALKSFKTTSKERTDLALVTGLVDEKFIMYQDADLWSEGPFCGWDLGFRGANMWCNNNWTDKDDKLFSDLNDRYKKNRQAVKETWKQCLIITKNTKRLHVLTPFIAKEWLIKKQPMSDEDRLLQEM